MKWGYYKGPKATLMKFLRLMLIFSFVLFLVACNSQSSSSSNSQNIAEEEAIKNAQAHLDGLDIPYSDREANASLSQVYKVVFPVPQETLGGDFIVVIDADTGEVISATIGR